MGRTSKLLVYHLYINKMKKKTKKKNEGWSDKYKKSINCNNPKGFSQKTHCAGKKKNEIEIPSPSRKMVKKMKKKGHTSVPYGSGYKKVNENKKTIDSVHKILVTIGKSPKKVSLMIKKNYKKVVKKFKGDSDRDL